MDSSEIVVFCSVSLVSLVAGAILIPTLNQILPSIRSFVYKRGYRPKWPSILFSPSLNLEYAFKDATNSVVFPTILQQRATYEAFAGPVTPPKKLTFFETIIFCPVCSTDLDTDVGAWSKTCPNGCGWLYPRENTEGLEAMMFDPYIEG